MFKLVNLLSFCICKLYKNTRKESICRQVSLGAAKILIKKYLMPHISIKKIMKKMKEGELITNPDDKREFKNIRFEFKSFKWGINIC